jgi:glycosyltransferase involved in cell wall biosynthesis
MILCDPGRHLRNDGGTSEPGPARSRLRVLMLKVPGVSFVDDWARAAGLGDDVVSITPAKGILGAARSLTTDSGVLPIPQLRPTRLMRSIADAAAARRLAAFITEEERESRGIDLVHGHFYSGASYLPALKRATGLSYVVTEHSTRLTGCSAKHKPMSRAGMRIAKDVYREASFVIVPSRYLARRIEQLRLCEPTKIVVLGNPVDTELFRPSDDVGGRPLRLVSVGRLEQDKDPFLLLEAFRIVLAAQPRLTLELIGDGPERARLQKRVERLGLADKVALLGWMSRQAVAERVCSATVFSLASRVETFCMAAAEAVAAGVPVVMPSIEPLAEFIDERSGYLVDPGDPQALAAGILTAVANRPAFDAGNMASRLRARFSYEAVSACLREVYARAVSTGEDPGLREPEPAPAGPEAGRR